MSIIAEYMKAKHTLEKVLSGEIKSYEEVVEIIGTSYFHKLWAKNIWELHTTEAPSIDLEIRQPSKIPKKKDWKILCNAKNEVFVVNCYTINEAIAAVKKYLRDDGNREYSYKECDDVFQREVIKLE